MSHPALASGHVTIVTGAAQGIVLAIVRALAARGLTDKSAKPPAPRTAGQIAGAMVQSASSGRLHIFCPDNEVTPELDAKRIARAAGDMIEGRPALSLWHSDFATHFSEFASASNQKPSYRDPALGRKDSK